MSHNAAHSGHNAHGDAHGDLGHILPMKTYITVLGILLVLTVLTVGVAQAHFPSPWNIIVAMLVASVKAMLVALFFMHLKYEHPATWAYAFLPIFLLFLLIGGVFIDNPTRTNGALIPIAAEIRGEAVPVPPAPQHPALHH
jgi:cytochrome c oxidase subunit 4